MTELAGARRDTPDTKTPPRPLGTEGEREGRTRNQALPGPPRRHSPHRHDTSTAHRRFLLASLPPSLLPNSSAAFPTRGRRLALLRSNALPSAGCCRSSLLPPWWPGRPGEARLPLSMSRRGRDGSAPPPALPRPWRSPGSP